MPDIETFFNDDPWGNISSPIYPNGQRLYQKDERFIASMNEANQLIFFAREIGKYSINQLPKLAGIEITIDHNQAGETRLICTLTDPTLRDKFAIVAKEVSYTCSGFKEAQFLEECKIRIISWADFLKPSRKGLTQSEWIGFWGELYALTEFLTPSAGIADAVKFWIGPDGKKQDFTFDNSALEIKTSLSGANSIKISSLDQLNKTTQNLYLLQLHINYSSDSNGSSLQNMHERAEYLVRDNTDAKMKLLKKTKKLYGKASEEQLETKFNFISMETYDVNADFPRLTNENTPSGISAAKYEINPSSLKSYLIELDLDKLLSSEG